MATVLVLLGCRGAAGVEPEAGRATAGLTETPLPSPEPSEVVLAVRSDGAALFGREEPPPPDADALRTLVLRAPELPELDGRRVLDARFAMGGVVLLDADRVLRFRNASGVVETLDANVDPPLSVEGEAVAYARGDMPLFGVARADVRTRQVRELAPADAVRWCPALVPGARGVVVARSLDGRTVLSRDGAQPVESTRVPTGPSAPVVRGDALVFEDGDGIAWIDLATGTLLREERGLRLLVPLPDGSLAAHERSGAFARIPRSGGPE